MERPTTTSMLFLDAMYRCKIKVICGSFCFPDQRNEEHPFDTVRYSVHFVFSPGDEAPRVFTIPKPQDVLWSVIHYLTLTKNKSTFARINILGQVILSLCCLSSKIIFSLPSDGGMAVCSSMSRWSRNTSPSVKKHHMLHHTSPSDAQPRFSQSSLWYSDHRN